MSWLRSGSRGGQSQELTVNRSRTRTDETLDRLEKVSTKVDPGIEIYYSCSATELLNIEVRTFVETWGLQSKKENEGVDK